MAKKKKTMMILKGHIGEIGFEYELKTRADNKKAIADLKAFSKKVDKTIRQDSTLMKRINTYKYKTEELKKQTKELEKQLKYSNRLHIIQSIERLIYRQIKNYKDWEIEELITNQILSTKRYGGKLRRLITEIIDEKLKAHTK